MAMASTTGELMKSAQEAREEVLKLVGRSPGMPLDDAYSAVTSRHASWTEPAVRTAIWDLISERRLVIRRGNHLYMAD